MCILSSVEEILQLSLDPFDDVDGMSDLVQSFIDPALNGDISEEEPFKEIVGERHDVVHPQIEIKDIIKEYGVEPGKLRVEITETVMMSDIENRMQILNELKKSGFIVEMDDFGSGYSSLNLLKDMPVDVLKIDMAFLNKSKEEDKAQTIVHNIINMSDELGIMSLTEGVETPYQYELLTRMGCKLFQGYYFSKPVPQEDFEKRWLDAKPEYTA